MRLRRKLSVAFFLVSTLVSVVLAVFLYRFVERQLAAELRARLRAIASIGAQAIDPEAYARLRAGLGGELDAAAVAAAEASPDYRRISDQLNAIRAVEPALIRFAYLLAPTDQPAVARYVVDADVLAGAPGEELSHYGQASEVVPGLRRALETCAPVVERDFVYDPEFEVRSVSAYVPLPGGRPGACPGVLGVDILDRDLRAALDDAGGLALTISLAVIALALVVSVTMGTLLTRSLLSLNHAVQRFAGKDFAARSAVGSRDEVGQLGASFNQMADTIQLHSENLEGLVEARTSELAAEKQTSERLLRNVLPGPIAERLKHGDGLIVDRFEDVSVLFADLVGFTALSARTTPERLVSMLDELFTAFDRLADEHGLEKIKTIGDAYMVVAGVPQPATDHAVRVCRMGLAMLEVVRAYAARTGTELTIRVGVHAGPVVAGVIGRNKFIYDLWGDTVNTASRLESHGQPGRLHVSGAVAERLAGRFELAPRGVVELKGKGPMDTFFVERERPAGEGPPPT
jgi:class 3 adenylate cyclase/ABC-type dipeptide/oligopeptide/nickel transport system permease subunit